MRWLNQYESFDNKKWTKITGSQFDDYYFEDKKDRFTKSDVDQLFQFNRRNNLWLTRFFTWQQNSFQKIGQSDNHMKGFDIDDMNISRLTFDNPDATVTVVKLQDDWFILFIGKRKPTPTRHVEISEEYICDEIDGLIECLEERFHKI